MQLNVLKPHNLFDDNTSSSAILSYPQHIYAMCCKYTDYLIKPVSTKTVHTVISTHAHMDIWHKVLLLLFLIKKNEWKQKKLNWQPWASHEEREIEITEINEKGIKKSLTRLRFWIENVYIRKTSFLLYCKHMYAASTTIK